MNSPQFFFRSFAIVGIFTLVCWALAFALARIGNAGEGAFPQDFFVRLEQRMNQDLVTLDEKQTFSIDGLRSLTIEGKSTDVKLVPTDTEVLEMHLTGMSFVKEKMTTTQQDGHLKIELPQQGGFKWSFRPDEGGALGLTGDSPKLTVKIPKKFVQDIKVKLGSGDIHVQDVHSRDLDVTVGSGDVRVKDLRASQLRLQSGSGDVDFENSEAKSVVISTGSGDISARLQDPARWTATATTGSGDLSSDLPNTQINQRQMTIGSGPDQFTVHSGSGDVNIHL